MIPEMTGRRFFWLTECRSALICENCSVSLPALPSSKKMPYFSNNSLSYLENTDSIALVRCIRLYAARPFTRAASKRTSKKDAMSSNERLANTVTLACSPRFLLNTLTLWTDRLEDITHQRRQLFLKDQYQSDQYYEYQYHFNGTDPIIIFKSSAAFWQRICALINQTSIFFIRFFSLHLKICNCRYHNDHDHQAQHQHHWQQ